MAIALVWTIINNNKWRHIMQIIICVVEIYGGWMTFAPGMSRFGGISERIFRLELGD